MKYKGQKILNLYKEKTKEHQYTLYDPILNYLGNLKNKRVLDLGCGSGELTIKIAEQAKEVVGADESIDWITECNRKYQKNNLQFVVASANNLKKFSSQYFDVVIMSMVLLDVGSEKEIKKIFSEVARVLKSDGDFIFSDLHPVCKMTKKEGNRRQEYSKNFSYFKNGSRFNALFKLPSGRIIKFFDHHWSLNFYSEKLSQNNLVIKKILETRYPKIAPKNFYVSSIPEYIIFCCKKMK